MKTFWQNFVKTSKFEQVNFFSYYKSSEILTSFGNINLKICLTVENKLENNPWKV